MAGAITVSIDGLPATKRLLEQFEGRQLQNRMRRALRAGAKVVRNEMRDQARSRSDLPKSFAKTRTRAHRNPLGVSVSPKSPLSSIFEHGAKSHTIAPSGSSRALVGKAGERSRTAAFFARGPVRHPGMEARPFIAPVFEASQDEAEESFGRVVFEGIEA